MWFLRVLQRVPALEVKVVRPVRATELAAFSRSKSGEKFPDRYFQSGRDPHEGVHRDRLFAAFDFPDVIGMQLGFLGELFLGQPRDFPEFAKRITENFPMFRTSWHSPIGQQRDAKQATVYSLYFS